MPERESVPKCKQNVTVSLFIISALRVLSDSREGTFFQTFLGMGCYCCRCLSRRQGCNSTDNLEMSPKLSLIIFIEIDLIDAPGLVNFIPAVFLPSHFFLNLPAAFTQPGASTLADLCTKQVDSEPEQ